MSQLAASRCRTVLLRRTRCDQRNVARGDQNAVAAIGKVEPRRAAGREHPRLRQIPAGAPAGSRRPRASGPRAARSAGGAGWSGKRCGAGRAEQPDAGRISACRIRACRQRSTARRAGGSWRKPPIADRSRLRPTWTIRIVRSQQDCPASGIGSHNADSVKRSLLSQAGHGRSMPDGWLCHLCHG